MFENRNKPSTRGPVDPAWDGRVAPSDRLTGQGISGKIAVTSGKWPASYGWISLLVIATGCVNVLTSLQHAGSTDWSNLRAPVLDETTSALVIICLLPLLKLGVDRLSTTRDRRVAFIVIALSMIAYALLHITLMVVLRHLAYAAFGIAYEFSWRNQFVIEFRKDLIAAFMIVLLFWLLGQKSSAAAPTPSEARSQTRPEERSPKIWLRDGATSIRVDATQIISVTSAGNYVEFVLPGQTHLIRGTLTGEEARLKPFGFIRIHRTRLINSARVVSVETRPNGDFVATMDTGEIISGSRRYKAAIEAIREVGPAKS